MAKPPKVKFRSSDPLQDFYSDREGNRYSVARLVDDTKHLKPFNCPLAALSLSDKIWDQANVFALAFHVKKVMEADLSKPIILDWNGDVADGRHRIIRALVDGKTTIRAVRMTWRLDPCRKAE
jgi:hypothetical protein